MSPILLIAIILAIIVGEAIAGMIRARFDFHHKRVCDMCWRDIKKVNEALKEKES